jgi:cadmium resistance protein CadD (predicted permease)
MLKDQRGSISDFMHWLGLITALTFIALGVYILYTDNLNTLEKTTRVLFSIFFFALGVFRTVNWVLKNKSRKFGQYEEEE